MTPLSNSPRVEFYLSALDIPLTRTSDVGVFIYDISLLYDICRLAVDRQYESYLFSSFSLYRNHRRLRLRDEMYLDFLSRQSPLEIAAAVGIYAGSALAVSATIWNMVQIVERVSGIQLNRRKLQLEIRKLESEVLKDGNDVVDEDTASRIIRPEALPIIYRVESRLIRSPVKIVQFDVNVLRSGEESQVRRMMQDE